MKKYVIAGIIILAIATCGLLLLPNNKPQAQPKVDNRPIATTAPVATPTPAELLALTNQARADNGLAPLTLDERLNTSAQRKADDQVKYGYQDHINPTTGQRGINFAFETMPSCYKVSENLAHNTANSTSAYTFDGLMNSPKHREAILDPTLTHVGFGITTNEVVQHFCTIQ